MYRSKFVFSILAVWIASCVISAPLAAQDIRSATPKELVFSATPSAKGVVYKVDKSPVSDPLRGLGKAIEKYGEDLPVVCLIDSRLPIRLVGEASALAGKAGFKNVRTFAVDHSSEKVSEIKIGPWMSTPQ